MCIGFSCGYIPRTPIIHSRHGLQAVWIAILVFLLLLSSFVCAVLVFLKFSYLFLVLCVFCYAANFATDMKMPHMPELGTFCSEYQNITIFAIVFPAKLKMLQSKRMPQTLNRRKFLNVTICCLFPLCPTFSFCLPTFIPVF